MTLTLAVFLAPYGLFLTAFTVFSLLDISHAVKYRTSEFVAFLLTFAYLAGTTLILFGTWYLLQDVSWSEQFTLFNPLGSDAGLGF